MPTSPPLLRGARWRLARPQSRALWTAASPAELATLFDDADLRRRTEAFLRLVSTTVAGIETLLVFDLDATHLALAVTLTPDHLRCRWDWIGRSLAAPAAASRALMPFSFDFTDA